MIYGILLGVHIVISLVLILVVLLQSGKGGGLAGAFGAAGGQTGQMLFGGRGAATFLSKATTILGIAFLTASLVLATMAARRSGDVPVIRDIPAGSYAPPVDAPSASDGLLNLATDDGEVPPAAGDPTPGETPAVGDTPPAGTPENQTEGSDPPGGN